MIDWRQLFTSGNQVYHGQRCAKGTRVFVTNILDSSAEGASRDEILASYPSLRPEHIDAAMAYAAELARETILLPLAGLYLSVPRKSAYRGSQPIVTISQGREG